jgi:hypothetical protein
MAWTAETCTGNAPDSLFLGIFTLPLNCLGIALLAWRPRLGPFLAVAIVPAIIAMPYTLKTAQLAHGYLSQGLGACDVLMEYGPWGPSGDEPLFLALWVSATAVFWLGLALAGWRAYRNAEKDETVEQAL